MVDKQICAIPIWLVVFEYLMFWNLFGDDPVGE